MEKARLIGKYCEYCGDELNTWDDRVRKALAFDFDICENCIAEEYQINIDYLRKVMSDRFGAHPCEGI